VTQKEELLRQSKERGLSTTEAHVLSIDPFFCGTKKDYDDANWIAPLWDRMMATRKKPLHLRGFHYWVMSSRIKKLDGSYYATDPVKDWSYLLHCAQIARYLGIGDWKGLVDLKHPEPSDYNLYAVESGLSNSGEVNVQEELNTRLENIVEDLIAGLLKQAPRYYTEYYQTFHCEIWCEKGSMGFVIEPACKKYKACYQSLVGQASVEKVRMSYERALKAARAGKKVRIWYISDFDRYGMSMIPAVARKLEFFSQQEDLDIKLTRLALNEEQIDKYKLPKAPKHGEEVVELDALEAIHPGELGKIIEGAMRPYYDSEKPKLVEEENRKIRERARNLIESKLREPLEEIFSGLDLEGVADGFSLKDTLDEEFEPPEPGHEVVESDSWVYDSDRTYWQQWDEYKKYKASRQEEEA